jgi:hypothetical protein
MSRGVRGTLVRVTPFERVVSSARGFRRTCQRLPRPSRSCLKGLPTPSAFAAHAITPLAARSRGWFDRLQSSVTLSRALPG